MAELIASNTLLRTALLVALFLAVAVATYLIAGIFEARRTARQRLLSVGADVEEHSSAIPSLRTQEANAAWQKLVDRVEKSGISLVDTKDETLRRKLAAAGFASTYAPRVFTLIRLVLVIGLPVLAITTLWTTGTSPSLLVLWFTLLISAAIGLYFPNLYIRAKADRRQREIINAFPDALDLMLVCVEAGLALESAFDRVAREMAVTHPLLSEQLGTVVLELRAGRSREDALRRLADRSGADEIRAFATLLIQSTNLGTSISQTLRVYAAEMREKRRMRAEEKAHRLPVLLSIPLVTCMLPVMIGVLMLPAVIRVMRTLFPALTGGG